MANDHNLEAGQATQFAAGDGRKRGGDKAWSIRNQLRYLAAQRVDITQPDAIKLVFGDNPTVAQRAAFNAMLKTARVDADLRAIEFADERIDGKLLQPTLNADLEAIKGMSEEEIDAELKRIDRELESVQTGAETGPVAANESDAAAASETAPVQTSTAS